MSKKVTYIKSRLNELKMRDMMVKQLHSYKLTLDRKGLAKETVKRKIHQASFFIFHMDDLRKSDIEVSFNNISNIAFEYVRDGYFTTEDKDGSYNYRRNIYSNIRESMNYIYEDMQRGEIIKDLTDEQVEILKEVSKNNWFRVLRERDTSGVNGSIQTQLMGELGLKVYFDEENKPYVLSHETAELLKKGSSEFNRAIRNLLENIHQCNFAPMSQSTNFSMIEDYYEVEIGQGATTKKTTYRLYKDLLFMHILGLTGDKMIEFKMQYIDAFNFIEEEYNKLLIKHAELKDDFLKMYNSTRKQNRDLLILKHKQDMVA